MEIHKKENKKVCFTLKAFSLLIATLPINYESIAMEPEDVSKQNQKSIPIKHFTLEELSSLSLEELETHKKRVELICSIMKNKNNIESSEIALNDKKDEVFYNKEKRKNDLSSMKRKEKLNEIYEGKERKANLTKTMVETLAIHDKSNAETMHLYLKNIELAIEVIEKNRVNTQSIFGKMGNILKGNNNSIDVNNQVASIENRHSQQRQETARRFDELIEKLPNRNRSNSEPKVEEVNSSDEGSDVEKKSDE